MSLAGAAQAASVQIPGTANFGQLSSAGSLTGAENVPLFQAGATKQSTLAVIAAFVKSGLAPVAASGSASDLTAGTLAKARLPALAITDLGLTLSGTTGTVATVAGTPTNGDCVTWNAGSVADAGSPCGSGGGGGSGTVAGGNSGQVAGYGANGTTVSPFSLSGLAITSSTLAPVYGTAANTSAQGNDARFPASVTGLRKGAGAGGQDVAAASADVQALLPKFTGDCGTAAAGGAAFSCANLLGQANAWGNVQTMPKLLLSAGNYAAIDMHSTANGVGLKNWHWVPLTNGTVEFQTQDDSFNNTGTSYIMKRGGPAASDSDAGIATTGWTLTQPHTWLGPQSYTGNLSVSGTSGILGGAGGSNSAVPVGKDGSNGYIRLVPGGGNPGYVEFDPATGSRVGYLGYADGRGNLQMSGAWARDTQPDAASNDGTIDTTANSQNRLSHVASAAALAAWTNYAFPVVRDDLQGYLYRDTGASCAVSGGDGGWQIQPASGHCWQTDISRGAPITLWGAVDDDATDAQPAFAKAVAAMGAQGGGRIVVPAASGPGRCYRINSTVAVASVNDVSIVGEGHEASCIDIAFASGNGITLGGVFGGPYGNKYHHLLASNLTFKYAVMHTAGAAVEIDKTESGAATHITCGASGYTCIGADGLSLDTTIDDIIALREGQSGIELGCVDNYPAAVNLSNIDVSWQHRAAIEICGVSGMSLRGFNSDYNLHSLWVHPTGGSAANGATAMNFFGDDYFDVSFDTNVLLDASQGYISESTASGRMWIVSGGVSVAGNQAPADSQSIAPGTFTPNSTAAGLYMNDASGTAATNLVNNKLDLLVYNNGGPGVILIGGANNQLSGTLTRNGINCTNGAECPGLLVQPGTSHWSWRGVAGGTTGGATGQATPKQTRGVYVSAGTSDYYSVAGDLSGNANGGTLFDGGSGAHKSFVGMLPPAPPSNYTPTVNAGSGASTSGSCNYVLAGDVMHFVCQINVPTAGTGQSQISVSLPINGTPGGNPQYLGAWLAGATPTPLVGVIGSGSNIMNVTTTAGGYPVSSGQSFVVNGSYQVASP